MKISGKLVDIHTRSIYPCIITIDKGLITDIEKCASSPDLLILPGLTDAHIHIESSMITPGAFAKAAVKHGTVSVVSDPHEIANVMGLDGVKFMMKDGEKVPVNFYFGAPSCVPATIFENSGASIDHNEVKRLLENKDIKYLSEMMNFPGVIYGDEEVIKKLECAKLARKPIDGHAPGLRGDELRKYIGAGISTDHECSSIDEAKEKIALGMKILIREGSAARNLESLKELFNSDPEMIMLCSDDLHPEMLEIRHINKLIASLISGGFNIYDVIRSATINPSEHYGLASGLLRKGDKGDFIIVESLEKMNIIETWINGKKVFDKGEVLFTYKPGRAINKFKCSLIEVDDLKVRNGGNAIRVIEAFDGELLTKEFSISTGTNEYIVPDIEKDILKIVVKDRYDDSPPAIGFIKGFGLKKGAFASSVAHDSHNIISVGTNDEDIAAGINEIVRMKGGLSVSSGCDLKSMQLNIGGIMSTRSCSEVAKDYENLNRLIKSYGSTLNAPFMTLSFMALLVIPDLKIGDKGLFDVKSFELVSLFI